MSPIQASLFEKVLKQIEHLPTLPQVVTKILTLADSARVNAADLSKEMDQSLSAKVLKVANSAYYGGRAAGRVTGLHHAIMIIGFDMVKEIVLTASFFHTFKNSEEIEENKPLWTHSLGCALIAKRLAWVYRYEPLDEAYLAGLIHDIGKLVIRQYFPDQHRQIQGKCREGADPLRMEKEILGLNHAEIIGRTAAFWNFQEPLTDALAHHHDGQWTRNPQLGRILHSANRFASGSLDFHRMLEEFTKAGMHFPLNWHFNELKRVEEIFQEELQKASALLAVPSAGEVPLSEDR